MPPSKNIALVTGGGAPGGGAPGGSANLHKVRVHVVSHVTRQDQMLLGHVVHRQLDPDHDRRPLSRERHALKPEERKRARYRVGHPRYL